MVSNTTTEAQLYTLPTIARILGVTRRRVEYAVESHGIEPVQRLGIARIYDADGLCQIRAAVEAIASRREVAHAV
jgi:hypothetical protein